MILENLILLITSILLVYVYLIDKSTFIFTPIKLFIFVSFLYLILPGFYFINFELNSIFWTLNKNYILIENIAISTFIFTFIIIFKLIEKIKFKTIKINFNSNVFILASILLIVSIMAKIYMYKEGVFFLEDKYNDAIKKVPRAIKFLNNIHLWGYMILFVYYFRLTKGKIINNKYLAYKYLALIYFIVTITIPILQGRRFGVIFPVLMLIGLYSYYHRIQLLKLFKYGILILIIFALITILRLAQSISISNGISTDNLFNIFSKLDTSVFSILFDGIISRLGNVYIILNRIIEYKSLYGLEPTFNSISLAFKGLIPSFLWYDKPSLSIGNRLGKELDLINMDNVLTGINAGWIGEGYYLDGLVGILIVAILYAFTIGLIYKIIDKNYDGGKLVFLMYFVFLFSGYQMELAMTFNNFVKGSIILLIILITISKIPALKIRKSI